MIEHGYQKVQPHIMIIMSYGYYDEEFESPPLSPLMDICNDEEALMKIFLQLTLMRNKQLYICYYSYCKYIAIATVHIDI